MTGPASGYRFRGAVPSGGNHISPAESGVYPFDLAAGNGFAVEAPRPGDDGWGRCWPIRFGPAGLYQCGFAWHTKTATLQNSVKYPEQCLSHV